MARSRSKFAMKAIHGIPVLPCDNILQQNKLQTIQKPLKALNYKKFVLQNFIYDEHRYKLT